MKHIETIKEEVSFVEASEYLINGYVIRSYISEYAYIMDKYSDIYTTEVGFCDKEIVPFHFRMIKLDEEVWNSGEVQGLWNVIKGFTIEE